MNSLSPHRNQSPAPEDGNKKRFLSYIWLLQNCTKEDLPRSF